MRATQHLQYSMLGDVTRVAYIALPGQSREHHLRHGGRGLPISLQIIRRIALPFLGDEFLVAFDQRVAQGRGRRPSRNFARSAGCIMTRTDQALA